MENTPNQAIVAENQKTTKKYPSTRTHIPVDGHKIEAVSYTHQTLPTKLEV